MAFFTETKNTKLNLFAFMSHALANMSETLEQRKRARETYAELAGLSDRELHDLGLSRGDIRRVAREAAQGKL